MTQSQDTALKLLIDDVDDESARLNFKRLQNYLQQLPLGKAGFKFFSFTLKAGTYPATLSIPHTLGFVPKDVLSTSVIGPGSLTWEYLKFTASNLVVTISDTVTVRAFIGAYAEGKTL